MKDLFCVMYEPHLQKINYLKEVADLIKRLKRNSLLVLKEMKNTDSLQDEVDDDFLKLAEVGSSCIIVAGQLIKYVKKIRFEPCWNFKDRYLVEDLKPGFDQASWDIIIDSCRFIERRNGILSE